MAKFIYRMQNILNIKEKLEEQARNDYAAQRAVLNEAEDEEERLRDTKKSYEKEAVKLRSDSLNIREIEENTNAIAILDRFIKEQHQVVEREEEKLEERRAELEEAIKERKTQEKLKEHAFDEFKAEINHQEAKEIDELTSYTFGAKKRGK
ncbi:MAG: flagellar export protein FliJ [Lachnospiraceae bacterium]|nr:flagellar export protein FliJ [Lachnospiraceae bacterium]